MSERPKTQFTQEQAIQALYTFAEESMRVGASDDEVIRRLTLQGADKRLASKILEEVSVARAKAHFKSGKRTMLFGVLWFVGGGLFTLISYASREPGGDYIVAWGAMLVGIIQFFRGLSLFKRYHPARSQDIAVLANSSALGGERLQRQVDLQLRDPTRR